MTEGQDWWARTFGELPQDRRADWLASQLERERAKLAEIAKEQEQLRYRVNRAKGAIKDVFAMALMALIGLGIAAVWAKYEGWEAALGIGLVGFLGVVLGRDIERRIDRI